MTKLWQKYQLHLETLAVFMLAASVRLTALNVFRAVDEEDRWAWAVDFYRALLAGNLPATKVGDGYPGIFPVWLETLWLFLASLYRSLLQGSWIGDDGVYLLIHQWDRTAYLAVQRFPVVLVNVGLVVIVFLYLRRLFDRRVALLAAIFISLDPFYLSDSRVNRAEALVTGLMTLSLLALIAALREGQPAPNANKRNPQSAIRNPQSAIRNSQSAIRNPQHLFFDLPVLQFNKHRLVSAIFGGLAWLTKLQALVLIPMFAAILLIWHLRHESTWRLALRRWGVMVGQWTLVATALFILLWPAMWVIPASTLSLMYNFLTRKVGEEGVKLFFMGQTVLNDDPGLLFYPVIFILRATPLMLIGLLLGGWLLFLHLKRRQVFNLSTLQPANLLAHLDNAGIWILISYALLYVAGMSLGSHKQDRFLMVIFPVLNLLAAIAFVALAERLKWPARRVWLGIGALLGLQLITALPYHPYYFSYFNPLTGGGPVAVKITRVGWGEGMDQVGAYLQRQNNPESLVVSTRFTHYLRGFRGKILPLDKGSDWVRADKIVFYIQQVQRMLDPSPGVIRYFQQHVPPEKVITINGINYAHIYPNPIQYPAEPLVDTLADQLRLFGYRWETGDPTPNVRLIWKNLGHSPGPVGVRLWSTAAAHGSWLPCQTAPGFEQAAQTAGEVVESLCPLPADNLPPGLYNLQVGLRQPNASWQSLDFAAGWSAVEVSANGTLARIEPEEAFAQLAAAAVPKTAPRLEHTYLDRVRLLAYQLSPQPLQPGQTLTVTLYWQAIRVLERDADVSLQAFIGNEQRVALVNGPPLGGFATRPTSSWRPGEVIEDVWQLEIPADTPVPALLRLDAGLFMPDTLIPLPVRNRAGEDIPAAIAHLRLEPERWPTYRADHPVEATFDDSIQLAGYEIAHDPESQTIKATLYWQSLAPVDDSLVAFLHLLDPAGQLVAQSDVQPANGLFPTAVWQPGDTGLSHHLLELPQNLPPAGYRLQAGLYHPASGARLPARDANQIAQPNNAAPIGRITIP